MGVHYVLSGVVTRSPLIIIASIKRVVIYTAFLTKYIIMNTYIFLQLTIK
jgi:hypothetical protein